MATRISRRQPLLLRVTIAAVVAAALRIIVGLGWLPPNWFISEDTMQDGIDAVLALWAFWSSHRRVTPVASPRAADGTPLVRARLRQVR